jgi:hypothetical protein
MWNPLRKKRTECEWFVDSLEDATNGETLPAASRKHVTTCVQCETAWNEFKESQELLSALARKAPAASPWFGPRVMAAIAAREGEMRKTLDAWSFVPKQAARLTWVSALALVLAGSWFLGRPSVPVSQPVATDLTGEPIHETVTPVNNDDLLLSLTETGS